ncbi:hypothetical protein BPAE_0212g00080 [Botrytis paeoniae]|uniref:Uncharacterized protein n=1 Tax=Botrytis paeoniae TaxID=278948 RepID=A0A4Z1FAU6_9HELO|nr:hypothetical protein BPAE_0212g00080 [Botrytis paeoniae]
MYVEVKEFGRKDSNSAVEFSSADVHSRLYVQKSLARKKYSHNPPLTVHPPSTHHNNNEYIT